MGVQGKAGPEHGSARIRRCVSERAEGPNAALGVPREWPQNLPARPGVQGKAAVEHGRERTPSA
jgi:hypothetical protein